MSGCAERRSDLAAHALGVLDAGPAAELGRHLAGCGGCRAELAELAAPVALLAQVRSDRVGGPAGGAPTPDPVAAGLADRLVAAATVRRRRLRRRWAAAVAAASVAAAALVVAVVGPSAQPAGRHLVAADPATGVGVAVTLRSRPTGTAISLQIHGVAPGTTCTLVAVARDGRASPAGSWWAGYRGTASVEGSTGIAEADLARLVVDTAAGTQLVVVPVARG